MEEKNRPGMEDIEIDLSRVFRAVTSRAWLVAIIAILCAALAFAGTFL